MLRLVAAGFSREAALWLRRPAAILQPVAFAVLVVLLMAFAVGPDPQKLAVVAPAALMIALCLAGFLQLDALYAGDVEDGSLDAMISSGQSMTALLYGKLGAFWLIQILIQAAALPVLMIGLQLPSTLLPTLIPALLMLSLAQALLGLVGAALTARLKAGAMLLSLLVLPQMVPVLIFATGAVNAAAAQASPRQSLLFLAALCTLYATFAPLLAGYALSTTTD
jgi:heme exporter protein B